MAKDTPKEPPRDELVPVNIEDQMKDAYIDYAMSVIIGRALPDVRDGLKPVHRRILYTMNDMSLGPDKPFRKSAKVVGDVMGRFHPHGDSAIYDAMVRMAQDFNMRYPSVQGHGNFGSIDGDSAAAMRYTEVRMAKIAVDIVSDIKMDTVDFQDSYDGTEQEPTVLPSRIPNLLVNGSDGIAVGMATKIPPHNLKEVVSGCIALIDNPEAECSELMRHVKGPDFPTAGEILGKSGIRDAYETGRGKLIVRGKTEIDEMKGNRFRIIVTEIPYQVNKVSLIEQIADLVRGKQIDGISDIRDESSKKEGIRVVIELKREVNPYVVQNQLLKHTSLQTSFGIILLAIHEGKPVLCTLKDCLWFFIQHRMEVVYRRTVFELKKAQARAHILEGLRIALENIDEVIEIIKKSNDGASAKQALMARFELSEIQSQAILDMRLQKLTGLETQAILDEYRDIIIKIAELEDILASEPRRYGIIKQELEEVKEKYGDKRRTIISGSEADIDIEDLIQKEEVLITITRDGWAKRLPVDTYRSQGRGGRGIIGLSTKKEDIVKHLFVTNTHDKILFFSSRGMVYCLKAYQIPQASRTAKGIPIVNLLQLGQADRVNAVIPIGDFDDERFVFFVTREGVVKKTALREFDTNRKGGIKAITLRQGDDLSYALLTDGKSDIVIGTRKGLSIRFNEEHDVRPMGRGAAGVRGITLNRGDEVRGAGVAEDEKALLCVCEKGYGKRTLLKYYKTQKRGGKGILTIKASERNGDVVGIEVVDVKEDLLLISEKGIIIRQPINTISATIGRSTQGVRLMRLDDGDKIVAFEVFEEAEDESFGPVNGDS